MKEPIISVGIMSAESIAFELKGVFLLDKQQIKGEKNVIFNNGKIIFDEKSFDEIVFKPKDENSSFVLKNVMIGKEFHWQQTESQEFRGALKFIVENKKITAVNLIATEKYLASVISSEMSANASLQLLKAHAVISRSWLLAPPHSKEVLPESSETKRLVWYERDAHRNYDVCADDHCQRYQGITRAINPSVFQAVSETHGEVLMYEGEICDTRFSKCCGGATENFENCWADTHFPYLTKIIDAEAEAEAEAEVKAKAEEKEDLTVEKNAEQWILSAPDAFCNTKDEKILRQVLNNYDFITKDFFRWQVLYSAQELSEIVKKRSGIDFGAITDLIPVRRGKSGRIVELKIVGTKRSVTVGKELEIRKWLSDTHLYSSAFVTEKCDDAFVLHGCGWGHGVGLCQIGAAVMGENGYKYDEILQHYFNGAELAKAKNEGRGKGAKSK